MGRGRSEDTVRATLPSGSANAEFTTGRIPPEGLTLILRQGAADGVPATTLSLRLHTAHPRLSVAPRDALGADFADQAELRALTGRNTVAANTVLLKRRPRGWCVYVDGTLSASFPERLAGPVEVLHDSGLVQLDAEGADDAHVQRVAPFRFTDAFLVDEADTEGRKLGQWEQRNGPWEIFTVQDIVTQDGPQRERRNPDNRRGRSPEADRSPNFYCVEGHGTNALLLAGYDFNDHYTHAAAVHAGDGECGLAFLATADGAFFALTAELPPGGKDGLRFILWRTRSGRIEDREILDAADTSLLPGQWHRLAVRLLDNRIIAAVDGIEVFNTLAPLPPGGRFGLFANTPVPVRFDDVETASHEDAVFPNVADFRARLQYLSGDLDKRRGALPLDLTRDEGGSFPAEHVLLTASAKTPALAVFGTPADAAHALATAVDGGGRPFVAGLVTGWQGPDSATRRFVVRQTATERTFLLEDAPGGTNAPVEVARLTLPAPPSKTPLQLLLDATQADGLLRAYADGRLVLLAPDRSEAKGAGGLWVPAGQRAAFALPSYRSERTVYRNKFEKTEAFVTDPFMRHWASPEGEWITLRDGQTWFKGDLFGAVSVHLPWVSPTRLHLAVPEGQDTGPLQVVAEGTALRLEEPREGGESATLATANLSDLAWMPLDDKGSRSNQWYSVNVEDHVLWVRSGDRTLFRHTLAERLPGRRMRVEGLNVEHLGRSKVERTGLVDFLFTESLHEWTINGGRWEVVNRFQCDPRWSHLNGQSADTLAALWSHYEFEGDFCAEFYAGMRHGWYDRPGDLNLTVLGAADSPASGYTFVCTGWDPDESQRLSRLFRNGVQIGETEAYMVPRVREGSVRRGYNPLVGGGRDVHGAWYYTQLRRVGTELNVSFDHEPVLTVRDPEPLRAGGLGIWTYRNSMVVARVKLAAEHIRPKRFAITPVHASLPANPTPSPWPSECAETVLAAANAAGVAPEALAASTLNPRYPALPAQLALPTTTNGIPLATWTPDTWTARDPVSNPRFDWLPTSEAPDTFVMRARQAAGTFFATNVLPAVPLRNLAGWRFEIARTADAHVNFHYTVGRMGKEGFEPAQSFFHSLSGSDETRGPVLRAGSSVVPPAPSGADFPGAAPWTTAQVWLPAFPKEEQTLWVRVDGFGNLQPSDAQQGLEGNPPGAAYAVRRFAPILLGVPRLEAQAQDRADIVAFHAAANALTSMDVHRLPLPGSVFPVSAEAHWVLQPANLALSAAWSTEAYDVVEIRSEIPWPVRFLKGLPAKVNGADAWVVPKEGNLLHVLLPRTMDSFPGGLCQVDLATSEKRPASWGLPLSARSGSCAPILLALESEAFRYESFEGAPNVPPGTVGGLIRTQDPQQGRYLRSANGGQLQRLRTPLLGQTDLARNPLVQFRYKTEPMSRISLRVNRLGDVAFTESPPYDGARTVRGHNPGLSPEWRTWLGFVCEGVSDQAFATSDLLKTAEVILQSCGRYDQTGRFSTLAVDDAVAGPAVGPRRPLTVTPRLFDLERDGYVEWALRQGLEPAGTPGADTPWTRTEAGIPLTLALDGIPDGIHHVLFRPASPRAKGPIRDLPILLDRQPIPIAHSLEVVPNFGNGHLLLLRLPMESGSPPCFDTFRATCGDQEVDLSNASTRISIAADAATLRINWPLLLRKQIQRAKDGDSLALRFDGLTDGAGNPSDPHTVTIPIRYADDHTPPTLRHSELPTNLAWLVSWTEPSFRSAFRSTSQCSHKVVEATTNAPAMLQLDIGGNDATATVDFRQQLWNVDRFPFLALRAGFAKLPEKTSPSTFRLILSHQTPDGKTKPVAFDLFLPRNELPTEVRGTVDWNAGGTCEWVIDVGSLLRRTRQLTGDIGKVENLQFKFQRAAGAQFRIQQAAICAPWGQDDTWTVHAYDASGVAGLAWQGNGQSDTLAVSPASLTLPDGDTDWLRLVARDRAGNPTLPMPLPMPRATHPTEQSP